jgi:S-adenosylmethionine-dependent methyltransferase
VHGHFRDFRDFRDIRDSSVAAADDDQPTSLAGWASMSEDAWAPLADEFVDRAYESVKGQVRTYVLHHQLIRHIPPPPAAVLDVGGGAGHQSLPLARAGYEVTLLDPSSAMLAKAAERITRERAEVRDRVRLVVASGENAAAATEAGRFDVVLCHGVLMYVQEPRPLIDSVCACAAPGGVVSVMALNAATLAIRPALERRWDDALAAFDSRGERGVLGVDTRADTIAELTELLRANSVESLAWYGVWLFTDWMDLATADPEEVQAIAAVELEASRRDPYRQLSRAFHVIGRRVR